MKRRRLFIKDFNYCAHVDWILLLLYSKYILKLHNFCYLNDAMYSAVFGGCVYSTIKQEKAVDWPMCTGIYRTVPEQTGAQGNILSAASKTYQESENLPGVQNVRCTVVLYIVRPRRVCVLFSCGIFHQGILEPFRDIGCRVFVSLRHPFDTFLRSDRPLYECKRIVR